MYIFDVSLTNSGLPKRPNIIWVNALTPNFVKWNVPKTKNDIYAAFATNLGFEKNYPSWYPSIFIVVIIFYFYVSLFSADIVLIAAMILAYSFSLRAAFVLNYSYNAYCLSDAFN